MTDETVLGVWATRLASELGIDADLVDVDLVLGLAAAAAHGIVRPAAPLTTFMAGVAIGRLGERASVDDLGRLATRIEALLPPRSDRGQDG